MKAHTKSQKAAQKKYEKQKEDFVKTHIHGLNKHLVVGENFLGDFKTQSTYYTSWGFDFAKEKFRHKLVAFLPLTDDVNTYYRTCTDKQGQMYVAVFLMKDRPVACDLLWNHPLYQEWAIEHPVTLYFLGCDDGSYSKRFKTEEEAIAYIKKQTSYEDVMEDNIGGALFEDFKKMNAQMQKENQETAMSIFDNYLSWEN